MNSIRTILLFFLFSQIRGEILENADMEISYGDPDFVWIKHKTCTFETVDISNSGQKSLKVFERTHEQAGPVALLNYTILKPNHSYYYSIYLNFLNNPTGLTNFNISLKMRLTDAVTTTPYKNYLLSDLKFQRANTGWHQFGADFRMPLLTTFNYSDVILHVKIDPEIDYLFDTASLTELVRPDAEEWKNSLNDKILQERTSLITISSAIPEEYNLTDLEIKVDMTRNSFYFGSAVKVDDFNDPTRNFSANYRRFFYDNFNLAVPANVVKWKQMEWNRGTRTTERVDLFLDTMAQFNIPSRGHTLLWGMWDKLPHWMLDMSADPVGDPVVIRAQVDEWLDWFCGYYGKSFIHLDVYNEHLQSQFYEDFLDDQDFLLHVFNKVATNCSSKLYLNDYAILRSGLDTSGQINLAKRLINAGQQLDGIGAQVHVKSDHFEVSEAEFVQKRLSMLCSVGLPVMITELSVHHDDLPTRAAKLDEVMRFFYSEPCIEGVNHWCFSDQNTDADCALAAGEEVQSNEAGDVWHSLVRGEWETHESFVPDSRDLRHSFMGHHGDYNVTVLHKGQTVSTSQFTLSKCSNDLTVHHIVF